MQKSESLCRQCTGQYRHPGDISTRPIETRDETEPNGIIAGHEGDRNRIGCRLGRDHRRAIREDHRNVTADQVGRKCGQAIVLIVRPTAFDRDVATLDIAGIFKTLFERVRHRRVTVGRCAVEKTDHGPVRPLCMPHVRPNERGRSRRAAEQLDELAPSHVEHGGSLPRVPPQRQAATDAAGRSMGQA